jgi:hypothetical protein
VGRNVEEKEVLMPTKLAVLFIAGLLFLTTSDVLAQAPSPSGKGGAQSGSKTPEMKPSPAIREQDKTPGAYNSECVKKCTQDCPGSSDVEKHDCFKTCAKICARGSR